MNIDSIFEWLGPAGLVSATLLAIALGLVRLLRRSSAAMRHHILASAFIGAAVCSTAFLAPKWNWPMLKPLALHTAQTSVAQPIATVPIETSVVVPESFHLPDRPVGTVFSLRGMTVLLWLAGVVVGLARLAAGLLALHAIARQSRKSSIKLPENLRAVARVSSRIEVPVTWGWWRPQILVPADFEQWSAEQQRLALLHECAHVRRRDWATMIVARIVCALYWFNPLAWISLRQLQAEQEKGADDLVLHDAGPDCYANALVDFARRLQLPPHGLPALPVVRDGSLEDRIESLVNPRASRVRPALRHRLTTVCLLITLALVPIVQITARNPPASSARRLTESERRFVGEWQGGGMLPSNLHFKEDGSYEVRPYPFTNLVRGTWSIDGDLFTYTTTSEQNAPVKKRRILQVSSNFFQWQFVGEESANIFGYHRLTNRQLGTIAGVVLREGKPMPRTGVLLEPFTSDGKRLPTTEIISDEEGRFAFHGLAPGLYKISRSIGWDAITERGTSPTASWTHGQIVALEKDTTVELVLGRGRTVHGRFVPPTGMEEQLAFTAGDFRFLTPAKRRNDGIPIVYVLEITQEGAFTIPDLPPGDYDLFAQFRKMNGALNDEHLAVATLRITIPENSGDFDLGRVQLDMIGK